MLAQAMWAQVARFPWDQVDTASPWQCQDFEPDSFFTPAGLPQLGVCLPLPAGESVVHGTAVHRASSGMGGVGTGEWERRPWVQAARSRRWGGRVLLGAGSAAMWEELDSKHDTFSDDWKVVA
eukprot:3686090-Pyramimonas_sp.AAC.1